jgi:hypothetical protein
MRREGAERLKKKDGNLTTDCTDSAEKRRRAKKLNELNRYMVKWGGEGHKEAQRNTKRGIRNGNASRRGAEIAGVRRRPSSNLCQNCARKRFGGTIFGERVGRVQKS